MMSCRLNSLGDLFVSECALFSQGRHASDSSSGYVCSVRRIEARWPEQEGSSDSESASQVRTLQHTSRCHMTSDGVPEDALQCCLTVYGDTEMTHCNNGQHCQQVSEATG